MALHGMERHGVKPERIHKLRTSSRRLRNLLQLAELWSGDVRFHKLSKKVGRMAAAFGPVRDIDVLLRFLDKTGTRLDPALRPVFLGFRHRFLHRRQVLDRQLPSLALSGHHLAKIIRNRASALAETTHDPESWRQLLANSLLELKQNYHQASTAALAKRDDAVLHGWRIAAKKLRYRLETLGEAELAGRLAALQDALGEAHDAAVFRHAWCQIVTEEESGNGCTGQRQLSCACARIIRIRNQDRKRRAVRRAIRLHADIVLPSHLP